MGKRQIEADIDAAYKALQDTGIAKDNKVDKAFRGQVSSFGAAVTMGSLRAAVAFFSQRGGSAVDRAALMDAILQVLRATNPQTYGAEKYKNLYDLVDDLPDAREDVLDAATALKLAMNLYELTEPTDGQ